MEGFKKNFKKCGKWTSFDPSQVGVENSTRKKKYF